MVDALAARTWDLLGAATGSGSSGDFPFRVLGWGSAAGLAVEQRNSVPMTEPLVIVATAATGLLTSPGQSYSSASARALAGSDQPILVFAATLFKVARPPAS